MKIGNKIKTFFLRGIMITVVIGQPTIANSMEFFGGKVKKKVNRELVMPKSRYHQLTGKDSVRMKGAMNVYWHSDSVFLELPAKLMGRAFLVSNKLQKVPKEMNEAGVNKGINFENQTIRFEWDKKRKVIVVRQQRLHPEVPDGDPLTLSVADNYIDPIIAVLNVEAVGPDSATVLFKVNDFFNGKNNILNDVFNLTNIGTSPDTRLSHIISVKGYTNSIVALSELTTVVHEGNSKTNVTVEVSSSIVLLPEEPMRPRKEDWRVGYFTTTRTQYSQNQQSVEDYNYITRWRLVPKDTAAYLRGELSEPVKPIVFYLGNDIPPYLKPYLKKGITDWNKAFERAGFKNAIEAREFPEDAEDKEDDLNYSTLTYDASKKANAMGPSTIDPRTGEILEADIIWWHNVVSLIREWLMVQTAPYNPAARTLKLPESMIGDAARFVICHEVGHSLGLRHNMIASAAYPTDSLRSRTFTDRVGGTSASIMDYARFNYVAQPGDGVTMNSPHIGPYDLMAIEWGYRWYPQGTNEAVQLENFLERHRGKEFRYSEAQSQRSAIDPRALSEDLGDNPILSATYGIENLKRIMPNLVNWTRNGKPGQTYEEAAKYYGDVVYQWSLYLYHVLANVGGIYLDRNTLDEKGNNFTFVEADKQKAAVKFLMDQVLCFPKWLFGTSITRQMLIPKNTPAGTMEQDPLYLLKNQQNYILWDLLDNERLIRMQTNELYNGSKAFTASKMMDMLHRHIFKSSMNGKSPDVMERSLQKSFVDALITAANESESVKINKKLSDKALSSGQRKIEITGAQVTRTSDAISLKRGELIRILKLCDKLKGSINSEAQMHYADISLRIRTALGL
jgi:hypothetical protein